MGAILRGYNPTVTIINQSTNFKYNQMTPFFSFFYKPSTCGIMEWKGGINIKGKFMFIIIKTSASNSSHLS